MIVLVDADSLIWSSCYKEKVFVEDTGWHEPAGAIEKFDEVFTSIINTIEETYQIDKVITFSGARGNFRKQLFKTYKANRNDRELPLALNELQKHVKDTYSSIVGYGVETDDVVATYWSNISQAIGRNEVLIVSIDKDYKQLPCIIYDYHFKKQCYYDITEAEARFNFYTQMIVGDTSDNVNYCKGYGIAYAKKLFKDCLSDYSYIRELYTLFKKIYKGKARERFIECYLQLKLKTE